MRASRDASRSVRPEPFDVRAERHARLVGANDVDVENVADKKTSSGYRLAALVIVLSVVPVGAGVVRLAEIARGAAVTANNARFLASPAPIVAHVIGVSPFLVLGVLQLVPAFRERRLRWHRIAGRALTLCGICAALSGLWMTAFYARGAGDGALLDALRFAFGSAMLVSLVLGWAAIRRRDVTAHAAWMTRAYAIGAGAITQMLVHLPWVFAHRTPGVLTRALLHGAGWTINLLIAEWSLRRATATTGSRRTADGTRRRTYSGSGSPRVVRLR